jgi:hypothetical protein
MVARILAGENQDDVIADLDARGILTAFGRTWTRTGLRKVLLRPLNAGLIEHRGEIVATLVGGEPLIDRDDYDRLVAMFAARRRGRPPSPKYLCSGDVAVCGLCGVTLYGRPREGLRLYPDGEVRREYWCGPSTRGCMGIAIDQRALDELAAALAVEILSDPRHSRQVEAAAAEHAQRAAVLDEQITADEELALTIGDRLGRREITLARHDAIMGPLDARLARLRAQRSALNDPGAVPAAGIDWAARWDAAGPMEQRRLLRLALRGRVLVVGPADPRDRSNVTGRVTVV